VVTPMGIVTGAGAPSWSGCLACPKPLEAQGARRPELYTGVPTLVWDGRAKTKTEEEQERRRGQARPGQGDPMGDGAEEDFELGPVTRMM
jgi:hypothetical protein